MRLEHIEEAVETGRSNQKAIALLANHCSHARVELRGGTSMLGQMYGLPIGLAEIRCDHASGQHTMAHQIMDLAVAFYEKHCVGCPFRSPNGVLPTVATEAERRREVRAAAERRATEAFVREHRAWQGRYQARRTAVAAEGYPVRDLAEDLDLLDAEPTRDGDVAPDLTVTRRRVVDTARGAPHLFTDVLVATVVSLAVDRFDPTACTVLRLLARAGSVPAHRAADIGARVLTVAAIPSAGQLVAEFAAELSVGQVKAACTRAITLAGDDDDGFIFGRRPPEPAALLALAAVDLPTVTDAVATALAHDDEQHRADAADAARYLLEADPARVVALGEPLVRSIRGEDEGYAGTPKPAAAAVRALAEAWRGAPQATADIIERSSNELTVEAREELVSLLRFLHRFDDDTPIPADAVRTAVAFALRRFHGGWGGRVADIATDELLALAKAYPSEVMDSIDALLAALLRACQPMSSSPFVSDAISAGPLAQLQELGDRMGQEGRRRDIADTIGVLAKHDADRVMPPLLALLDASTGDDALDSTTRTALVHALAGSVTSSTVARVLPTLYTCLLSDDQVVRAAAVELWQACARQTATLPDELGELVPTLLTDPYLVVHRAMLRSVRSLQLPREAVGALLTLLMNIAHLHATDPDEQLLEDALRDVLWAADQSDDLEARRIAGLMVVATAMKLRHYPREQILLDQRIAWLRPSAVWATAALRTLADPHRPDRFNQRNDKLLAALLMEPRGLAEVPLPEFRAIADIHLPDFVGSAAEPVELLQAAGRWDDAATLAEDIVSEVPDTTEREFARYYLRAVAAGAAAEHTCVAGGATPRIPTRTRTEEGASEPDFIIHARCREQARVSLSTLPSNGPGAAANTLAAATDTLTATPGGDVRVSWHISVLRIAGHLLRHDAAVRAAVDDAPNHLAAARRQAAVLAAAVTEQLNDDDPILRFTDLVATLHQGDVDAALRAAAAIPVALPLSDRAFRRPRRSTGTDAPMRSLARTRTAEPTSEAQTAVCVLSLDDQPVVDVVVVRTGFAYDLTVDVRLDEWPDWADRCHVDLLTTLPHDALTRPQFSFMRRDVIEDAHGIRLTDTGTLLCRTERRAGREPLDLPLHVRFSAADGTTEVAPVGGYRRLRLRPYDPSLDVLTQHSQMDQRLLELYDPLHDDLTLDADDVASFCRLFTACVRAAHSIMFDAAFRAGRNITEQQFHDALEERLRNDPELEGRLTRRDPVGGGYDDLLHDDVIAELKVEKKTPRTVDDCARYVGQPTQYGVGRGSRLSILVVLDHSRKAAPPAVLENYIGWLHPAHHGLEDPRYPSRVGVLIINTSWRLPSSWSRRRVPTRSAEPPTTRCDADAEQPSRQ